MNNRQLANLDFEDDTSIGFGLEAERRNEMIIGQIHGFEGIYDTCEHDLRWFMCSIIFVDGKADLARFRTGFAREEAFDPRDDGAALLLHSNRFNRCNGGIIGGVGGSRRDFEVNERFAR